MKATLLPLYFTTRNQREEGEYDAQLKTLEELYGDVAEFLPAQPVGGAIPAEADAVVFPQLIGEAFRQKDALAKINIPIVVLTSQFGTVEMWDWEIVSFLREEAGLDVFAPYNVELARVILRSIACRRSMLGGKVKFLMFQDTPGEGMQANIFKRFYWWEQACTEQMEKTFNVEIIYRSYKELNEKARQVSDAEAQQVSADWSIPQENVPKAHFLKAVKLYIVLKQAIDEVGGVQGIGANCLNESFNSETTPCLAWNMLYERDGILWACEGDTVTMVSKFVLYSALRAPIMMTNIYPFLVGMAALKHEKIDSFPDVPNPDNHALGVHCGYFGLAPQSFCSRWTLKPKVLEIVSDDALMVDCEMAPGPITMAKIHPNMKKLLVIQCEIVGYEQYPGSDCRNGALIHYRNNNGHQVMETLCSHHALLIQGDHTPALVQLAKVFGFACEVL